MEVNKTKIKHVSYERLESDPRGYNNTRIGMVADLNKDDDPVSALNELKVIVDTRLYAYQEVRTSLDKIRILENSLSHMENKVQQIKLGVDQVEHRDRLKKDISDNKIEIQKLHNHINKLTTMK